MLFSHPKNFTPICTTELGYTAKLKPEFEKRGVKVIDLSVDPLDSHEKWAKDIAETQGYTLNFPLIADPDRKVANLYGMIHPNASDTLTVRSVFIIGPDKKIKLTLTYPASTGRNFDEILRVIDSLQLTSKHQVATPVNWKLGEDVIIVPSVWTRTQKPNSREAGRRHGRICGSCRSRKASQLKCNLCAGGHGAVHDRLILPFGHDPRGRAIRSAILGPAPWLSALLVPSRQQRRVLESPLSGFSH